MLPPCLQHLQSITPQVKEAKVGEISGDHLEKLPPLILPAKSESEDRRSSLNSNKASKKAKQLYLPLPSTLQQAFDCPLATSHLCSVELTISGPASVPMAADHIFAHQPLPTLLPTLIAALKALMKLPDSPACCPLPYCSLPLLSSDFSSHMRWEHQFELLCCHLVLLGGQQTLISALVKACSQSRVRQFLRFVLFSTKSAGNVFTQVC